MIYFIKCEVRNGSYFKVGFTTDLDRRMEQYYTAMPTIELLECIATYSKTKHSLETAIHNEIRQMGYEFVGMGEDKRKGREWFFVDIEHEREFEAKGLAQFKACKGRKIYKAQK